MTRGDVRSAALLLDRAAAETAELRWIAPLALLKELALTLDGDAMAVGDGAEALLARCEAVADAASRGEPLPPDAPRLILFDLIEAGCAPVRPGDADALRDQCARCAGFVRAAWRARPILRRAWRGCPQAVRREEEAAFERQARELEDAFARLLRACEASIRADGVHRRARQARAAQRALGELDALPIHRAARAAEARLEEMEENDPPSRISSEIRRLTGREPDEKEENADVSGGDFPPAPRPDAPTAVRREPAIPAGDA